MQRQAIQIILIVAISGYTHILNGQVNDAIREYLSSYEASLNNLSDVSFPHDDRMAFRLEIEDKYYTENTMIYNHLFKGGTRHLTGYEYVENLLVDYNELIRHRIQVEKSLSTDPYKPVIVVKYTLSKGDESKVDRFQFTIDVRMLGRGVFKRKILSMMPYEESADKGEERKEVDQKARERRAEGLAWSVAKRRNTKAGYEEYLAEYPDGAHAEEAERKLEEVAEADRKEPERRAEDLALTSAKQEDSKAWDVINYYLKAIGGEATLRNVSSVHMKYDMNDGPMTLSRTRKVNVPNQFLETVEMNGMVVQKQVYNNGKGMAKSPQGKQAIEGDELQSLKMNAKFFDELYYDDLGYKVELMGIENVNGRDVYKVKVIPNVGKYKTCFFDVVSGLKLREISTSEGPQGPETITVDYKDYDEVDGIKVPMTTELSGPFPHLIKMEVKEVKLNVDIDRSEFKIGN